jgi:hypothetical protein
MLNACHQRLPIALRGTLVLQGPTQMTSSRRGSPGFMWYACEMDPVLAYRGFSSGVSSSGLSALHTLHYKFEFEPANPIFKPFSTAVWGNHPLLRLFKRIQRASFEPTYWESRPEACFLSSYHGTRDSPRSLPTEMYGTPL